MPTRLFSSLLAAAIALACLRAQALPVTTKRGLVVAAHPLAAEAGAHVLAKGGNAADALVATAFALAVVEPHSSGLGGGGFALLYDAKTKQVRALDFREIAPAATTVSLYERDGRYDPQLSRTGGLSVGVPGAVAGYARIAKEFGRKPLKDLVAPAATFASNGFALAAAHRRALGFATDVLALYPDTSKHFLAGDDALGSTLKQPKLAALLRAIGARGPKAFYEGRSAQAIVRSVKASGGVMTLEDLAKYEARPLTPIEGTFRGHRVVTIPPPSAGGLTILATLAVLDRLPKPPDAFRGVERVHHLAEIWKRSYAARAAYVGDPRVEKDVAEWMTRLASPLTYDAWAKSITPAATPNAQIGEMIESIKEGDDTSHLCAVDAEGNVALMTTTINFTFGAGVLVPELGVVLNNELDDFAPPSGANLYGLVGGRYNGIAANKTPVSTMAPTLVFDGDRPWIGVGAAGGSTIATSIAQIIVNVVDGGMDVQQAVAAGRVHVQYQPDELRAEPFSMDDATRQALTARGHRVVVAPQRWGSAQAITIGADGLRQGSADPRGEGAAVAQDQLNHYR